jgi:hypothetical protein
VTGPYQGLKRQPGVPDRVPGDGLTDPYEGLKRTMSGQLDPDIVLDAHDDRDISRGHQLGDLVTALDGRITRAQSWHGHHVHSDALPE